MKSVVNWFEIPVTDFKRALGFYNDVMATQLIEQSMGDMTMGIFPHDQSGIGGAIVEHEQMVPAATGTVVYLNGGNDLQPILDRVIQAGGNLAMPKTHVGDEVGYVAIFQDSEGNHVGLHSPQ